MPRLIANLTIAVLCFTTAAAERVMVPLPVGLGAVPGGYDSLWRSVLVAHNSGSTTAQIRTSESLCSLGSCPGGIFFIPPGQSVEIGSGEATMLQMFSAGSSVSLSARVYDLSRRAFDWGTELPLVAPESFRPKVWLLDVATEDSFRLMLRVYELNGGTDTDVIVRIHEHGSGNALSETVLKLDATRYAAGFDFGLGQLPLPNSGGGRVHVELEPREAGKLIWGFVSITHNETQRVTLVTPHPALTSPPS